MYENEERHTWVDWMRLAPVPLMACFPPPPEDLVGIVAIFLEVKAVGKVSLILGSMSMTTIVID